MFNFPRLRLEEYYDVLYMYVKPGNKIPTANVHVYVRWALFSVVGFIFVTKTCILLKYVLVTACYHVCWCTARHETLQSFSSVRRAIRLYLNFPYIWRRSGKRGKVSCRSLRTSGVVTGTPLKRRSDSAGSRPRSVHALQGLIVRNLNLPCTCVWYRTQ